MSSWRGFSARASESDEVRASLARLLVSDEVRTPLRSRTSEQMTARRFVRGDSNVEGAVDSWQGWKASTRGGRQGPAVEPHCVILPEAFCHSASSFELCWVIRPQTLCGLALAEGASDQGVPTSVMTAVLAAHSGL